MMIKIRQFKLQSVIKEFGLWFMEGSLDTWSWSLNVLVLSSLSETDEVLYMSQSNRDALEQYKEQRTKVSRLKKKRSRTEGFKEYKKIIDWRNFTDDKIKSLKARSKHLAERIEEIEPSGWKEFLKISNVVNESRALDINTQVIFPLGETAAAIRGEPAVCASVISEGIKVRSWENSSHVYEPSTAVTNVVSVLDEQRRSLIELQEKHGAEVCCCLDSQFSGMVEAWASGLTWREMMMDCAMDDGDLARLLRQTIDLLAQILKLPDIDPVLQKEKGQDLPLHLYFKSG